MTGNALANLRLLYGYMYGQPGKKLLFMGGEWGQWQEWKTSRVDWHQCGFQPHYGIRRWITDLNRLYASEPALYEGDCFHHGFEWVDHSDAAASI